MRRFLLSCLLVPAFGIAPAFAFKNFTVPSSSMLPMLDAGDLVTVAFYGVDYNAMGAGKTLTESTSPALDFQPKRGDVAAFQLPGQPVFIKRIVGIGGDRVQMRGGHLFLNGAAVDVLPVATIEGGCPDGATCAFSRETLPGGPSYVTLDIQANSLGDDTEPFTVPADQYFMVGDNRDNSNDSRFGTSDFGMFGTVPRSALIGRVHAILYSPRAGPSAAERLAGFPNVK